MASIFTRIIQGDIPGRIVWRDEQVVAMIDIRPCNRGHTLVIPIREIDEWTDVPADLASHAFAVAHKVAAAQKQVFTCKRIGLLIAGFEVPHTHLHVIPIDSMTHLSFASADDNASADDLDAVAEELRTALRAAGHAEVV